MINKFFNILCLWNRMELLVYSEEGVLFRDVI